MNFATQNFSIGGQGQPHLHIQVDNGPTRHFFNGQSNKVVDSNGQLTSDVQWQSASSFRLNGLSVGTYQVTVKLTTASDVEFVNQQANPAPVTVTINPPPPLSATLTITNPTSGSSFPSGQAVPVSFTVQNFTVGGQGLPHLHMYLDSDLVPYHFYGGTPGQVLYQGSPAANMQWQSDTSFQITGLSTGSHTIRLRLADANDQELTNAEAQPPDRIFVIQSSSSSPTMTITSPAEGAQLPPGPVLVVFNIQNSPVPPSATQPRMHFYVDSDPVVYKFYDGPGIVEDGNLSGVRYQGSHTHFVHWKSGSSIQFNALASGQHSVRFVLVDQNDAELSGTTNTLSFSILPGSGGTFTLQPVVTNLDLPSAMATTPDGRILVNELRAGTVRVVTPTTTLPWQVQTTPFATLPVQTAGEQGLLGIAVDPNFSVNGYVYIFYTAAGPVNRVVRFTATQSNGNTVAAGPPTVILDNIPSDSVHNGGAITFGPDGMLYIFTGENGVSSAAQDLTTFRGKILRIAPDGSAPVDNPFFSDANTNTKKVYSYGHRNSFGLTFHPHTGDLWETENGPTDSDEINRIVAGGNYGWDANQRRGVLNDPCCVDPIYVFTNVIAPTGIVAIREDSVYPAQYHNNLLFGDFINGRLHRIILGGPQLTDFGSYALACDCGQGGLLAVMHGLNVPGQDGYIYVTNYESGTASIFRVVLSGP